MKKLLLCISVFLLFTFFTQAQSVNNEKDTSCIHGQGYWKNHSDCKTNGNGNSRDKTWDLIEGYDVNGNRSVGEQTIFFKSNQDYCEVFDTNPGKGGKYYILAHKYIATQLNILGTPNSLDSNNIFDESTIFLSRYTPKEVDDSKDLQAESVRLSSTLAGFSSTLYCNDIEPPIIGVLSTPVNIGQTSLTLNWTAASDNVGVTNYKIFQDNTLIATVGDILTYDVTGLNPATLYSFYITALDAEGNESADSNTVQGLTIDIDPPVIGVLSTPVNIEQTSMTLNWTAATDNVGVTNYNIYKDGVLEEQVGNVLTYNVSGLNPATTYTFYITALDDEGNESEKSNTVQGLTIDNDPPVIGVLSTPVNIEQTSLTLNWTAATDNLGVTNYKIFQDNTLIDTVGNVLTYDVTGLNPATFYSFHITALDAEGNESSVSNTLNVTTLSESSNNPFTASIETTSTSLWSPTKITNSGAILKWEVTGGVTIGEISANVPTFELSGNTGTAIITITSDDGFVGLTEMDLRGLDITSLEISNVSELTQLIAFSNNLNLIDLSGNSNLTDIRLQTNNLSALTVSNMPDLAILVAFDNALSTIDVGSNLSLTGLNVKNNNLSTLNIDNNSLLNFLSVSGNNLPGTELDYLVNKLDVYDLSNGALEISGNPGSLTSASLAAYTSLTAKGWTIDVPAPTSNKNIVSKVSIYPNPISNESGEVSFKASSSGVAEVKLYGSTGQIIGTLFYGETEKEKDNVIEYDLNKLEQGMYFAVFKIGNETIRKKILITK